MSLAEQLKSAPIIDDADMAERHHRDFNAKITQAGGLARLTTLLEGSPAARALIDGIFSTSPYLSRLILSAPATLEQILLLPPHEFLQNSTATLFADIAACTKQDQAMRALRQAKRRLALLTALADIGGVWDVMQVTRALSDGADLMLKAAIRYLLRQQAAQGKFIPVNPDEPELDSGYIILGMGKYGAYELNYSSDIDLIVFYDPCKAPLAAGQEPSTFFVRLTRDLVKLMAERTPEGYVFRTDLRLRPDPGATQVALSIGAGLHYYESVGQNWERAAYIKARAVAGDIHAGEAFLQELAPYVWRKYLDYAAIADIHAMKRQIHAHKGHGQIAIEGHNLKLGRGGIREIEFFVQTQQLIAGGRQPELRTSQTLEALDRLVGRGWIERPAADDMSKAYCLLRGIEHRLQMLDDEQTHSLPARSDKFERVAHFSAYENSETLAKAVRHQLETVQKHYAALFEDVPELSRSDAPGSLVFTGDSDDPDTVATLADMGFSSPPSVISTVKAWHHGRYAATRTARAREALTEFQPRLLEALSHTAQPDLALSTFNRFLAELPVGIQLFAMLRNNPALLELLGDIMGSAPRLAKIVSRRPRLMDAVLDPGFLGEMPKTEEIAVLIQEQLAQAETYEACLDQARLTGREQMFLIGVHVLSGTISAERAGFAYATIADQLAVGLKAQVEVQLTCQHGHVEGGEMAVLAMGKLGGREMTANSDLDLVIIYRYPDNLTSSTGQKALAPSQYYARATQRLISALSAPTAEGRLYEVDMRLRPSGKSGPVATSLASFISYQNNDAWTWEHMALTRARIIAGSDRLRSDIEATIAAILASPRDRTKISADVLEMRERIAKEKGSKNVWDLKYVNGGLVDVEFIAQYLQLIHANKHPEVLDQNTVITLEKMRTYGLISADDADILLQAAHLYHGLIQIMRLCQEGRFDPEKAPPGLKTILAQLAGVPEFSRIAPLLQETQSAVAQAFAKLVR